MAKRPVPPSSAVSAAPSPAKPRRNRRADASGASRVDAREQGSPRRAVDVRGWLGGIRLSGFMLVMMGLVVLAAFVLVPTFSNYVQQRQSIAALERKVEATADEVAQLEAQRERWRDPAYITTQARERLYYQMPGEVVYLIANDLDAAHQPGAVVGVDADVTTTRTDWMTQLLASVVASGSASTVVGTPEG